MNDSGYRLIADRSLSVNATDAIGVQWLSESDLAGWSKELHGGRGSVATGDGNVQPCWKDEVKQVPRPANESRTIAYLD